MKNTMEYKGYVGSVEFSEEDGVFFGKVMGIRALISYEGTNAKELVIGIGAFEECNKALVRMTEKADLKKINKLIDTVEGISDIRREFYKTILKQRYEKILMESYNKLQHK